LSPTTSIRALPPKTSFLQPPLSFRSELCRSATAHGLDGLGVLSQAVRLFLVLKNAPADVGVKPDQEGYGAVFGGCFECVWHSQEMVPPSIPFLWRLRHNTGAAGHLSTAAMASELNARGVCACRGRWMMRKVRDTLREMQRYKIDYEPEEDVALTTQLDAAKAKTPKRSKGDALC
jgi:hypothetical protein